MIFSCAFHNTAQDGNMRIYEVIDILLSSLVISKTKKVLQSSEDFQAVVFSFLISNL